MYTQGEWKKVKGSNVIEVHGRGRIAVCPAPADGGVIEFVANAHLIAAAPKQHDALIGIVAWFKRHGYDRELPEYRACEQALAEGEV